MVFDDIFIITNCATSSSIFCDDYVLKQFFLFQYYFNCATIGGLNGCLCSRLIMEWSSSHKTNRKSSDIVLTIL